MFRETRSLKSGKAKFSSYDTIHTKRRLRVNFFQDAVSEQFKGLKSEEFNFKYGISEILKAYDFLPLLFSPSNACHTLLSTLFTRKKKNPKKLFL